MTGPVQSVRRRPWPPGPLVPLDLRRRRCIDRRNTDSETERESALFFRGALGRTPQQQRCGRKTIWLFLFESTHVEVWSLIDCVRRHAVRPSACSGCGCFTCDIYTGHIDSAAALVLSCAPNAVLLCRIIRHRRVRLFVSSPRTEGAVSPSRRCVRLEGGPGRACAPAVASYGTLLALGQRCR